MIAELTIYGHHQTMKSVTISELKAHLSAHLAEVRRGEIVLICDRKTPIARIVPLAADTNDLELTEPSGDIRDLRNLKPVRLSKKVDVVKLLREDRDHR